MTDHDEQAKAFLMQQAIDASAIIQKMGMNTALAASDIARELMAQRLLLLKAIDNADGQCEVLYALLEKTDELIRIVIATTEINN